MNIKHLVFLFTLITSFGLVAMEGNYTARLVPCVLGDTENKGFSVESIAINPAQLVVANSSSLSQEYTERYEVEEQPKNILFGAPYFVRLLARAGNESHILQNIFYGFYESDQGATTYPRLVPLNQLEQVMAKFKEQQYGCCHPRLLDRSLLLFSYRSLFAKSIKGIQSNANYEVEQQTILPYEIVNLIHKFHGGPQIIKPYELKEIIDSAKKDHPSLQNLDDHAVLTAIINEAKKVLFILKEEPHKKTPLRRVGSIINNLFKRNNR